MAWGVGHPGPAVPAIVVIGTASKQSVEIVGWMIEEAQHVVE
jgi:hypothetical protein